MGLRVEVLNDIWIFHIATLLLTSFFSMLTFAVWAGGVSADIPGHYGPSFAFCDYFSDYVDLDALGNVRFNLLAISG